MEPDKKPEVKTETVETSKTEPITTAPVIPPPVVHEFHEKPGRRWPIVVAYLLAALIVAVIVVYLARWIYHKTTHQTTKPVPAANTSKVPEAPVTTVTPNQTPSSATTPSSGTSPDSSSGAVANQNQTPQSGANGQLPNSGPGDVVAIFLGVSLIFGGLHYLLSLRRSRV
ncbi:hypothetical protein HYW35_02425 [Candidatus Saccharibacteria bacterium]|nr:hypothetical protein [Candidatus Saccharibacteria bacterium]